MCSNAVKLDKNLITDYLNNEEWQQLTQYLLEKFTVTRNEITGQPNPLFVTQYTVDVLSLILNFFNNKFEDVSVDLLAATKAVFRSLRNSAAFNSEAQLMTASDLHILKNTNDILHKLLNSSADGSNECVNMILQFLTNAVAKNLETASIVWKIFESVIIKLFVEPEYSYLASALLYNIVYLNRSLIKDCNQFYLYVLEAVNLSSENEYQIFLLELFLQDVYFMNLYETFEVTHRITILSALGDFVSSKDEGFVVNSRIVQLLTRMFKSKSDCILKTVTSYVDNIEPQEVVLLLEVLASLSSEENYCQQLQNDKNLITNCAFLLTSIHNLGKQSQNNFTPIQKLSEVASTNNETRKNPVFGFKADLIRFLGNVCWKNKENQDKLREFDCIPLLLDCCNIDARNPFIIQWTILAIRNLCESNPENQRVIAGMTKQGVVNCSTLQEMGLELHDDGTNKIILGPPPESN